MNFFARLVGISEIIFFLCLHTRPVLSEANRTLSFSLAPRLANFKTSVHRLLEGLRIRKKRRIQQSDELAKPGTPNHELRVGSLSQEYGLQYLTNFNLTFWISLQHQSKNHILIGTQQGHMILFELSDSDDREANTVAVSGQEHVASKAMAFSYYDEQWFAVLQSSGDSTWLRFYQRVARGLEGKQTIILDGEADFDLVTVKGVHYLAVVTYRTAVQQSMLTLYHWTQTQFDKIASRHVQGARSVSCWVLDGSLYMAVAQEVNEEGNYRVGSPIFLYNAKDDDGLVLLQMVDTYGPKKVIYFFVSGSHYIIFFGQEDAAIYWWSSDQFLFWQRIEGTAFASDAAVLALANSEAMIVIALKEEVYFYAQDFSGRYIRAYSMSLTGRMVSLQFMFSGKAYYALARFMARPQSIWKLTLDTYSMPTKATFNPLHQCLLEVTGLIDERQTRIEEAHRNLGRVWLKNGNQTITAEVIVAGQTSSSSDSAIIVLVVTTDHKVLPDTSMPLVEHKISNIKPIVSGIQQSIAGSVLKSGEQKIIGNKHFVGAITIPSLNLQSTNIDVPINGIPISRIHHFALRKYGNQAFKYPLTIDHVACENVWEMEFLNGISVEDLLLLGDEQTVTGILKFSDIITLDVVVGSVNSIPIESFVTTSSNQIIRDLKNIHLLQSNIIDVHGETNGEYLQKFSQQVVSIFDDDEISANCIMESPLEITGDFYLSGLVNRLVDLEQLATYSVLKHTEQALKGPFVFVSQLQVIKNLLVSGHINNIDPTRLVTLSTEQTISGDILFKEQFTISLDLVSNNVNGIDLDKTVVRNTTESQFVVGSVTFDKQLNADEIIMTDFVTLDSVDPSLLVQEIVKHEEGVVTNEETVFHDAVVLGDLVVSEGVNGYAISDLPSTVWLKSSTQTVEVPIHILKVTSEADMEATWVNTIHLDLDVAHSYKNETIMSVKTFLHEVVVPKHVNTNKVIFNGLDIISLKDEMDHLPNDGKIYGQKTLHTLEIHGDIAAELFNDLKVNELMHPTMPQEVKGEKEFLSETVIQNVLFSDSVNFDTFNGRDLQTLINNAVVKAPKHTIRNKRFWTIEGQHIVFSEGSTLGGINFSETMDRIATLNTRQEISVQKTFTDYVQLEKSSSVSYLNNKSWNEIFNSIVFLDEPNIISSQKAFAGGVQTGPVTVVEFINGLNITRMTLDAFLKSRDNAVVSQMNFLNDVAISNLDVQSSIDGLSWKDFIYTHQDERLEAVFLFSDAILGANMRVDGLLNECDILKIGHKAIYANKSTQFIKERLIVQQLNIVGNLHMKEEVNQISIEDIQRQFITIAGDQIITSNVQMGSSVKAVVLNLLDLMNDVDITTIMNDAVRHSFPQAISGLKNFDVVRVDAVTASELFIVESLDDVDVNGILNNAVWKVGDQVIDGDKRFFSIKSNNVEVHGFINGVRLPDDVVKTDTSDHISGDTTFRSYISLGSDIFIHGQINGVNLLNFISNRATLSGEQVISSSLEFNQDVSIPGNLIVDETVNGLFLDLVCRIKQAFPIEGQKTFVDFYVEGSLFASSVNGYDVTKMDRGILRFNRNEILNGVQVFKRSFQAQNSLFTEWINGKNLTGMVNLFLSTARNYNRTINYFDELSYGLIQHINSQLQASTDRITRFAYFILVQDIDLGPTNKILYGHDLGYAAGEFLHSMVIWTSEKNCVYLERCCHQEFSYWMRVKKSGHLMIDSTPEKGKYYPIQNPPLITADKDFVFWTDSATVQPRWCNSSISGELLLASLKASGTREVFWRMKSAPSLSEAKSFWRGQHLYAVAGFYFNRKEDEYSSAVVYVFNEINREWRDHQYLQSYGVLSLDITHNKLEDEILLAIGTGMGTYSSIYIWNDAVNEFGLLQNIPPKYVTCTLWLKQGSIQLLAMSSVDHWPKKGEDCFEFLSGGQVDIYVYEGRAKWIQSIPLRGVVSMISLTLADDTFLVVASHQLQSIFIYEWKGYAGFSLIQTVFVGEVRHLNTYTVDDDIYITVAITSGPSKLLKVVLQGKHALAAPIKKEIVPRELKDEAIKGGSQC